MQLVLGIDFGTAYTKCVLRNTDIERCFPLDFTSFGQRSFLVPSELVLHDRQLYMPFDASGDADGYDRVSYLKMGLFGAYMDGPYSDWTKDILTSLNLSPDENACAVCEGLVTYYLSRLLNHALCQIGQIYPDFNPAENAADQFFVNICVPVSRLNQSGAMEGFLKCLQKALQHGWIEQPTSLRVQDVNAFCSGIETQPQFGELCFSYPEVAAGLISFVRSPAAQEGVYGVVDVGAGTSDVTFFINNLSRPEGRTFSFLGAEVHALGAAWIDHRASEEDLNRRDRVRAYREGKTDGHLDSSLQEKYQGALKWMQSEMEKVLAQLFMSSKTKLTSNSKIPDQLKKIQVLILGGGGNCRCYPDAVNAGFKTWGVSPPVVPLQVPDDIVTQPQAGQPVSYHDFLRLTVAHGLSFHRLNLDECLQLKDLLPEDSTGSPSRDTLHPEGINWED